MRCSSATFIVEESKRAGGRRWKVRIDEARMEWTIFALSIHGNTAFVQTGRIERAHQFLNKSFAIGRVKAWKAKGEPTNLTEIGF